MAVEDQEGAGNNETPAAAATDSLINSRREILDLVLIGAIAGIFINQLRTDYKFKKNGFMMNEISCCFVLFMDQDC
jgi:hypothetical protein